MFAAPWGSHRNAKVSPAVMGRKFVGSHQAQHEVAGPGNGNAGQRGPARQYPEEFKGRRGAPRCLCGARIGRRALGGALLDPLALAARQHVAAHDLADDPGDERIPPRLRNQPATPLELIQRR